MDCLNTSSHRSETHYGKRCRLGPASRTVPWLFIVWFLLAQSATLEAQPVPAGGAGAEAHPPQCVDLDTSFNIPLGKENHGVSHTPAVLYTADGKRMLTATADKRLVVFDAKTRKLLFDHKLQDQATDGVTLDRQGKLAAWVLQGGGIVVIDTETGKTLGKDPKASAKWVAL